MGFLSREKPTASSGCPPTAWWPVMPMLRDPRFSSAMRWLVLLLSGIMVAHNVAIRTWGVGTFPSFTRNIIKIGESGGFSSTPLIDAHGKPSFLRYARTPAGRFMHILPAGLWSVIAPMQLSPTFRSKHRTAHRRMGRLFIAMSVSMSVGIVPILTSGATIIYQVFAKVLLLVLTAFFLGSGLLALHHARNKRIAQHRVWILRHVAMGYTVHLQRLLGYLTWGFWPVLIPGYTDFTPEGFRLRSIVFGSYFFFAAAVSVGSMELWLHYTSPSGAVLDAGKKKQAS